MRIVSRQLSIEGLAVSSALQYLPHYTLADYLQWSGEWELYGGVAISMTPSPFGKHQFLSLKLARLLLNAIEQARCQAVVLQETDWIDSDDTVIRPDVSVLCGDVPEGHIERTPAFIAEILSPKTQDRDRSFKKELFLRQGVGYYAVVDPQGSVELYSAVEGDYQSVDLRNAFSLCLCEDCEIEVEFPSIFK